MAKRLVDKLREMWPPRNGHVDPTVEQWPEEQRGDEYRGDPEPPPPELGIRLSTVQAAEVEWLWPGRIPRGMLTLIDGDPGLGKSTLTMDLAARVSRGMAMPDDAGGGEPAGVVILNAEDDLARVIRPRLDAAGADVDRILALETIPDGKIDRPPQLPADIPVIAAAIRQMAAALVIIDPLMAYLASDVNSHRDQDVRLALHPLAKMAEESGAAVLINRHLNKGTGGSAVYRGGGSIGIIGAARSALLVARDPDNPDKRVLASVKSNVAKLAPSLSFDLSPYQGGLRIGWMGESSHDAESLLAAPMDGEDRSAVQEAIEVLRTILGEGPLPAKTVMQEAKKAGIKDRTLLRAKGKLGIKSLQSHGFGSTWKWFLPGQLSEVAKPGNLATSGEIEPLPD